MNLLQMTFYAWVCLWASSLLAAPPSEQVELAMKLMIDGKSVSSERQVVNYGEKVQLSHVEVDTGIETFVQVVPRMDKAGKASDGQVAFELQVIKLIGGREQVIARPQMKARIGQEASFSAVNELGQGVSVTVVPNAPSMQPRPNDGERE